MNMSNSAKVIGFVGIEQFDIILYLSRVLKNLNKKVMLLDLADNKKLSICIPYPDQLLAKNKNNSLIIDYSGIDIIINNEGRNKISNFVNQYDFILIDFGFDLKNKEILLCDELFLVTDLDKTNSNRFNNTQFDHIQNKYLIFREVVDCKITPFYVLEEHIPNLHIDREYCSILYQDYIDTKMKLNWQYDEDVRFKKLSRHYKNWIKDTVTYISGLTRKDIEKAYKAAERGA